MYISKENEKELSNKIICVCIFLNVYKLIYIYIYIYYIYIKYRVYKHICNTFIYVYIQR